MHHAEVALSGSYDIRLVILSVAIAILASYTALDLAGRVTVAQGKARLGWLMGGAMAMGTGIWAMHFIAMLAFCLPVTVSYDVFTVFLSILAAILASGLALFIVSRSQLSTFSLLGGSLFMGLGIAVMHYTGMAAMQLPATLIYNPVMLFLSILVAITVSGVALWLSFHLREAVTTKAMWQRVGSAVLMGLAVPAMHYTGMAAATFVPTPTRILSFSSGMDISLLAMEISTATLIILGIALLTSFLDQKITIQTVRAETLRESEEQIRTLLQDIQVGVLVTEATGKVEFVNSAVLELLNCSEEELMHSSIFAHTASMTLENGYPLTEENNPILEAIATQQAIQNVVLGVNQGKVWLLVNAIPQIEGNSVVKVICTLSNITQRRQMEEALRHSETANRALAESATLQAKKLELTVEELKKAQSQLIHTEKMSSLGQMVAGIAHEINNPVSFIHGNLDHANTYLRGLLDLLELYAKQYPQPVPSIQKKIEEIELEFLSDDLPKVISSMKKGTERIREIVLSLRNFSRLDEAQMKPVDIHEGIDSTLLLLQKRLTDDSIRPPIQVVKDYGYLPQVNCYAGQLNQVFMNIINNAIDALEMPNLEISNPQIIIRTEVIGEKEDSKVRISFQDNGPGIPPEAQNHLFEPFFTTKPVGKGTGLGLSISYQIIVNKHRGVIEGTSTPGKGSQFRIEIPLYPEAVESAPQCQVLPTVLA